MKLGLCGNLVNFSHHLILEMKLLRADVSLIDRYSSAPYIVGTGGGGGGGRVCSCPFQENYIFFSNIVFQIAGLFLSVYGRPL